MPERSPQIVVAIDRKAPGFSKFLAQDGKTVEQFDRELLPLLRQWIGDRRHAIATALIRLEGDYLYVTLGVRSVQFDFQLAAEVSDVLLALCHQHGWAAVQMLEWPGNPSVDDLAYASSNAASEAREGG